MGRAADAKQLRRLLDVRHALRLGAERRLAVAHEQAQAAAAAHDMATAGLRKAEDLWHAGVSASAYPPEWLATLGAQVIESDHQLAEARTDLGRAEDDRARHASGLRLANACERVTAQALSTATRAEARRREERRIVDRPPPFAQGLKS